MKVFVVLEKRFFISHGIDYACATGKRNLHLFKKFVDASVFRDKRRSELKERENFLKEDFWEEDNAFIISRRNGDRDVLQILDYEI